MNKPMSYFSFAIWGEVAITKLVWRKDVEKLGDEADELGLLFGVRPANNVVDIEPENVWSKEDVIHQMSVFAHEEAQLIKERDNLND